MPGQADGAIGVVSAFQGHSGRPGIRSTTARIALEFAPPGAPVRIAEAKPSLRLQPIARTDESSDSEVFALEWGSLRVARQPEGIAAPAVPDRLPGDAVMGPKVAFHLLY
ncbi:hypothetical protein AB7C87_08355 [Natrarchaeobius sp. A-rgal3]|uniref:hypothetical protein n=1 Tax=Natrarchaeobius versutus TaxID=1679078 RepID=UPI0035104DC2